jgi:prohibitin 1
MALAKFSNVLIGTGAALTFLGPSLGIFYVVDPGERAIIFNKFRNGIQDYVLGEGLHWRIPFAQDVIKYDVRLKPFEYPTFTGTKDLQKVNLHLRILYRPVEEVIPKIHLVYDKDYANRLLPSIGNEVLKSVIAQYDADQLLKNREKISTEIKDNIVSFPSIFF